MLEKDRMQPSGKKTGFLANVFAHSMLYTYTTVM